MFWLGLLFFITGVVCLICTVVVLREYKLKYGTDLERFLNGHK